MYTEDFHRNQRRAVRATRAAAARSHRTFLEMLRAPHAGLPRLTPGQTSSKPIDLDAPTRGREDADSLAFSIKAEHEAPVEDPSDRLGDTIDLFHPWYDGPFFDIHSHLWFDASKGVPVIVGGYLQALLEFMERQGILAMAVSAQWRGDRNSPAPPTHWADMMAEWASESAEFGRWPDACCLLPFARGFELDDPDAPEYLRTLLATGKFAGVGELMVHGYEDYQSGGTTSVLMDIYQIAADHDLPVLVHWDVGAIKVAEKATYGPLTTVEDQQVYNRMELEDVLGEFPLTPFILAHCGAGPMTERGEADHEEIIEYLGDLLALYDNLYLDLSGMWADLPISRDNPTLGCKLRDLIDTFPERFLIGFDTGPLDGGDLDPRPHPAGRECRVEVYRTFLGYLSESVAEKVAWRNADALLNGSGLVRKSWGLLRHLSTVGSIPRVDPRRLSTPPLRGWP